MTRSRVVCQSTRKHTHNHDCMKSSKLDRAILIYGGDVNATAGHFLGSRKHSFTCLRSTLAGLQRVFKWSIFRLILFCAINDIPFVRDFTNADHQGPCRKAMECHQCVIYYYANILHTGFRNSSHHFLRSIIKKINKYYIMNTQHENAEEFFMTVFKLTVKYNNIDIFKYILQLYKSDITPFMLYDIIAHIHEIRNTIDLDFLTLCLKAIVDYVTKNNNIKNALRDVSDAQIDDVAYIWREIVMARIPPCRYVVADETPLPDALLDLICDHNYVNPEIRWYLYDECDMMCELVGSL